MKLERALSLAVVLASSLSFAHESGEHVRGVIESRDKSVLVVRTGTAKQSVRYDAQTRFLAADHVVSAEEARVGRRVVVHAAKTADGLRANAPENSK